MNPPNPTPPPRPSFIKGPKVKKLVKKRENTEIWPKIRIAVIFLIMVGLILSGSYLYTSNNRVKTTRVETNQKKKEELEELKKTSEKKEAAFEEIKFKKDTLTEDDINLLAEAVKAQEDYVSKTGGLSSDNGRYEGLRKKYHIINAEVLRQESRKAEEAATLIQESNPAEAKSLLRKALTAERKIETQWVYSGLVDKGKIARLDTRLRRLEAIPIWEKTRQLEAQAENYFKEEKINLAADTISESIQLESIFLENYRDVLNTEFNRIVRLTKRKNTYFSYPLYKELLILEDQARAAESEKNWEEATVGWDKATAQLKKIIEEFPLSEYADRGRAEAIEKKRNIARATPLVIKLQFQVEELRKNIREGQFEGIPENAKNLLNESKKIERNNPGVLTEDNPMVKELTYLNGHGGTLKIINNALSGLLVDHPKTPKNKLLKQEVTQSLYEAIIGKNPSAVVRGNLPVESVNYNDTQTFCEQLGWITARKIRLPTPEEFKQAVGDTEKTKILGRSWLFDNTDGITTRNVATAPANEFGFYDLIGNVEEWVQASSQDDESSTIMGGSVNWVYKPETPSRRALKRERSRTLGFRIISE